MSGHQELLNLLKREDLTDGQKALECDVWLAENPQHEMTGLIQHLKSVHERIAQQTLERAKRSFWVMMDRTVSLPYFPLNHAEVKLNKATFVPIHADEFPELWKSPNIQEDGNCDDEIDVQHSAVDLLRSVLKGMEVDHLVEIGQKRTLAGAECDILLIYKPNRLPFAAIEVKKPGNSQDGQDLVWKGDPTKGGNRVAGEVYDELKAIQLFGFSSVTGMITTSNQWRVVGLIDCKTQTDDPFIIRSSLVYDNFKAFLDSQTGPSTNATQTHSPYEKAIIFVEKDEKDVNSNKRRLWAGDIVPCVEGMKFDEAAEVIRKSGKEIINQIVFFVIHACSNLHELLQIEPNAAIDSENVRVKGKMPCRILVHPKKEDRKKKENVFAFGTVQLKKLNLNAFCECAKLYVIRHLGMGEYGNVCLAVSEGGTSCCAVKFYHDPKSRQQFATNELGNWNRLYGDEGNHLSKAYVMKVEEGECLVMPYLHPITSDKHRKQLIDDKSIAELLRKISSKGYLHVDIKWRHFRLLKTDTKPSKWSCTSGREDPGTVYLVDLGEGSLQSIDNDKEVEGWINRSIQTLRGTISTQDGMPVTPNKATKAEESQRVRQHERCHREPPPKKYSRFTKKGPS